MEAKLDKGYAWVICFSCFWITAICDGVAMAFGVLMPSVKKTYNTSSVMVAIIGSLHLAFMYLFSVPVAIMSKYFGPRKTTIIGSLVAAITLLVSAFSPSWQILTASYGIVAGFGLGMTIFPAGFAPNMFFEKRLSIANAIVFSGSSMGYLALAPLLSWTLENYGLKEAFLLESGLTFTAAATGLLIRDSPQTEESRNDGASSKDALQEIKKDLKDALTNKRFVTYLAAYTLSGLVITIPVMFLPSMLTDLGIKLYQASLGITIIGVFNMLGRLLCGLLDLCPQYTIKTLGMSALGSGLSMTFMVPYRNMLMTYIVCCFYGLLTGPIMALGPPAMVRLVKKENLSTAMGLAETSYGMVLLTGKIINYGKSFL